MRRLSDTRTWSAALVAAAVGFTTNPSHRPRESHFNVGDRIDLAYIFPEVVSVDGT